MQPFSHPGGPRIEPAVRERLQRLDRALSVTFSPWALDPLSGRPIEWEVTGQPIPSPGFYLWHHLPDGRLRLVDFYEVERGFGHRELYHLEKRARAKGTPSQQVREALAALGAEQVARRLACADHWHRVLKANARRMLANADPNVSIYRDPRFFSYAGQRRRTSSGEGGRQRVMKDARKDGWELPERPVQFTPVQAPIPGLDS